MKNILYTAAILLASFATQAQVGIGTVNPNASSMLDITSTTKGFLQPRMSTLQRGAISSPAKGLQVFDTDTNTPWFFDGSVWVNSFSAATISDLRALGTRNHITQDAGKSSTGTDGGSVGDNIGIGASSLGTISTGANNVAIGTNTQAANSTGSMNTAVGTAALTSNLSDGNTSVGFASLSSAKGNYNTALGFVAGNAITTGTSNIAIGQNAQVQNPTSSNQLSIGNTIYGTNLNSAAAKIGIGTTTPARSLEVNAASLPIRFSNLPATASTANVLAIDAVGDVWSVPASSVGGGSSSGGNAVYTNGYVATGNESVIMDSGVVSVTYVNLPIPTNAQIGRTINIIGGFNGSYYGIMLTGEIPFDSKNSRSMSGVQGGKRMSITAIQAGVIGNTTNTWVVTHFQ